MIIIVRQIILDEMTLEERRKNISLKFAKNSIKHPKMKHLFRKHINSKTRSGDKTGDRFIEPRYNTKRANNGPVNYFIRLLNNIP